MSSQPFRLQDLRSADKIEIRTLYQQLLNSWNKRSCDAVAVPFAEEGDFV